MKNITMSIILATTCLIGTAYAGDGKSIFMQNKCNECHTVKSQEISRNGSLEPGAKVPPDLSGVGNEEGIDSDWLKRWLHKEQKAKDGKLHMKKFKGADAELEDLTAWLLSLKNGPAPSELYKKQ